MVSHKKKSSNKCKDFMPKKSHCIKSDPKSNNTSEVDVNSQIETEKKIYLDYSKQIVDPKNTLIQRNPNENEIKVLIVPEKGEQTLIIFTLPKDVNGTVQDIITRLSATFIGEKVKIFLVTDPVHNVRYILQTFSNPNMGHNVNNNSLDQPKKAMYPAKGLSCSYDEHSMNGPDNESASQESRSSLKRNLQILTIYPSPPSKGNITITMDDLKCLENDEYLNDIIIDFYLKYLILEKLSPADQERVHLFSSFFYTRLTNPRRTSISGSHLSTLTETAENQHANVKRWTKHMNIFEKDFVIIPIHENFHWFLTIICYPNLIRDRQNDSKSTNGNRRPCILIFESISSLKFKRSVVAQVLKNYLQYEYKAKFQENLTLLENDFEVFYPDVPRQHNSSDCGLYLLQYAENFFKDYVISKNQKLQLPLTSLENWFGTEVINEKRDQLKKLIIKLASDSQVFKKRREMV